MSLLDRIAEGSPPDLRQFQPWRIGGAEVGWVRRDVAERLQAFPSIFSAAGNGLDLMPHLSTFEQRSSALNEVAKALADNGILSGWRNELFPIVAVHRSPPLAALERAAVPIFGVQAFGVHMNGFVRRGSDILLWVGQRAADRPIEPGKLDHLVAGGLGMGLGPRETLVKEAWEEASIEEDVIARAIPVGAIRYRMLHQGWMRNDTIFVFDLELPADFVPRNRDGEIASFELLPIGRVESILAGSKAFKFNVAVVVIDFLIRHGHLGPERTDYADLAMAMWRE